MSKRKGRSENHQKNARKYWANQEAGNRAFYRVFGGMNKPENDGVSGILNSTLGHLTIHTFSRRDVIFVDFFRYGKDAARDRQYIADLMQRKFSYTSMDEIANPGELIDDDFGTHLIIETQKLLPQEAISLPSVIIGAINMTPLTSETVSMDTNDIYCVIQPITESHIAIHTCGEDRTLIDVFSCKPFKTQKLLDLFNSMNIDIHTVDELGRGVKMLNKVL